jgi:hypothetical protein
MDPKLMTRSRRPVAAFVLLVSAAFLIGVARSQPARPRPLDPGFHAAGQGLTPSERAGREIWFKATAGNGRFHTYVFQQRLGVLIDWNRVLRSSARGERFKTWGLINDPDCCTPGTPNCAKRSLDETFGFDYCPGDDDLLAHVGKPGYEDPACTFEDAPLDPKHAHGAKDQRQSACDLAFGTSTGALGFRKFPNPRFDPERWRSLNGAMGSWEGVTRALAAAGPDGRNSHLLDGSIEPPFQIGMSCGACHIASARSSLPWILNILPGRTSTALWETSTAAPRRSWPRACRRAASSGRSSPMRGQAHSTHRRSRTTR